MTQSTETGRSGRILPYAIALAGSAYPWLFHRTTALDVGPYGGIVPLQWSRLLIVWALTLLVLLAVALLMWRLSGRPFPDTLLAATAVSWGIAFGWRLVIEVARRTPLPAQIVVGGVFVLLAVGGWLLLRLTRTNEGRSAVGVALAVPLLLVGWQAFEFFQLPSATPIETEALAAPNAPTTWVLVFDGMPNPEVLDDLGWDSGVLVEALESRGFEVPRDALSFSTGTYVTLASMLSLESAPRSESIPRTDQGTWLAAMVGSHPLASAFAAAGFDVVTVDNAWSWTRCGASATDCRARPLISDLEWSILVNSLGEPLASIHGPWRTHSLRQLDELEALAEEEPSEPRLIYSHLLIPHFPFELDTECGVRLGTPERPETEWLRTRDGFVDQMSCTADRIIRLVEKIPDDDVVVIIGDHGSDLSNLGTDFTEEELRDRTTAFVAVKGCELPDDYLSSNVNAFRGVASCVTDTVFPPWPGVAVVACVDLTGDVRLVDATGAVVAGESRDCRE